LKRQKPLFEPGIRSATQHTSEPTALVIDPALIDGNRVEKARAGSVGHEGKLRVGKRLSQTADGRCRQNQVSNSLELKKEDLHGVLRWRSTRSYARGQPLARVFPGKFGFRPLASRATILEDSPRRLVETSNLHLASATASFGGTINPLTSFRITSPDWKVVIWGNPTHKLSGTLLGLPSHSEGKM
jgi:hypothetical protein